MVSQMRLFLLLAATICVTSAVRKPHGHVVAPTARDSLDHEHGDGQGEDSDDEDEEDDHSRCMPCVLSFAKHGGCEALAKGESALPAVKAKCERTMERCSGLS